VDFVNDVDNCSEQRADSIKEKAVTHIINKGPQQTTNKVFLKTIFNRSQFARRKDLMAQEVKPTFREAAICHGLKSRKDDWSLKVANIHYGSGLCLLL
jgi:hypothetical protein